MNKRILLLHATAGAGHTRAAEAIAAALRAQGGHDVMVCDTLNYTNGIFRRLYAKHYIGFVKAFPRAWGYIWETSDSQPPDSALRQLQQWFNRLNSRRLLAAVERTPPDLVVCTHHLPLELMSYLKARARLTAPVFGVVTDISPHSFRILPHIDHYFVPTPASARELETKGCPANRITVSGIPIDPIFEFSLPPTAAREKHGLPLHLPTVLVMAGGFGLGPLATITSSFAQTRREVSLIVVAGRSAALRQKCEDIARRSHTPIKVFGYVDSINELIDAADMVITKPGGLSTSEILAKARPMVLIAPIPGQEQRNCEYLLENGAAVRLYNYKDAAFFIDSLLADAEKCAAMTDAARRIAAPCAAHVIAEHIAANLQADAEAAQASGPTLDAAPAPLQEAARMPTSY